LLTDCLMGMKKIEKIMFMFAVFFKCDTMIV